MFKFTEQELVTILSDKVLTDKLQEIVAAYTKQRNAISDLVMRRISDAEGKHRTSSECHESIMRYCDDYVKAMIGINYEIDFLKSEL